MVDPVSSEYPGPGPDSGVSGAPGREADTGKGEPAKAYALVRRLFEDLATLLRKELALAASEVNHAVRDTKKGVAGMVSGAVVLNSGFIFLLAAATLGLAEVVEPWLAALIVGVIATIVGLIMVQAGKKKLEPSSFRPERTMEELRKDRDTVKGSAS